jgi:hypothetical protein
VAVINGCLRRHAVVHGTLRSGLNVAQRSVIVLIWRTENGDLEAIRPFVADFRSS